MNTMFFNAVSCFFVCAGLIIALILAINVIFHRQSMKIMNIVWVLTGLWGHYFALFAYYGEYENGYEDIDGDGYV